VSNKSNIPRVATYRVQLCTGFGFEEAAGLADYLAALGVSHLYPSPYFQTPPGSTNGYAVVDFQRVNSELGGPGPHAALCRALQRNGLAQLCDMVPNHMAMDGAQNAWLADVLRRGPSSAYAHYFDIDWNAPEARMQGKMLLPVLPDQFGHMIESGKISLQRTRGQFTLSHARSVFPVALESLGPLLDEAAAKADSEELAFVADMLARTVPLTVPERDRDQRVLLGHLETLCEADAAVSAAIDQAVAKWNADPDLLENLLRAQHYRLAYWRTGIHELNYRRFFNIDALIGLRVEEEDVFEASHALALAWVREGVVDGLRIDHIDGLRDPEMYLRRLRQEAPAAWLLVEKILVPPERLPESWPVAGTTGYDFLNLVAGLFIDPAGEEPLTRLYQEFTGETAAYTEWLLAKKGLVAAGMFGGELNRLANIFVDICEQNRRYRDFTRHELFEALYQTVVCLPVYRAYVRPETGAFSEQDVAVTTQAVERAKALRRDVDPRLLDFLRDILLLRVRGSLEDDLVLRFQQLGGPVMAKGLEDTAFYCYNRLIALNEVGGDPDQFATSPAAFHARCREAAERWPHALLATATHDTKRGEDVRLRIAMLSEMPGLWGETVRRWAAMNGPYRTEGLPERNAEYMYYQTLAGAWPIESERAVAFMYKAAREAKMYTSWIDPEPVYDAALRTFVEGTLSDAAFCRDVESFVSPLVYPARVSSLAQTLIKLTAPGVPDIYQGCELWDMNLVDPDNRRLVDYETRRARLAEVQTLTPEEAMARMDDALPKLMLIHRALQFRRQHPDWFESFYQELEPEGGQAAHVIGYLRGERIAVIAPRLLYTLGPWGDTRVTLPPGSWRDIVTGESVPGGAVPVAQLLKRFPVALLAQGDV